MTFEEFLIDKFAEQYQGLDDDMPDAEDKWFEKLTIDDWLEYGDEYGKIRFNERRKQMTKNNPQAFPQTMTMDKEGNFHTPREKSERDAGMSLRDDFAGQALIGLLVAPGQFGEEARMNEDRASAWAYSQAESMLKEREKYEE